MTQEHPITPPSEGLVLQWSDEWYKAKVKHMTREKYMCKQAARWGADMELKACCEWLGDDDDCATLRAHRRPKPPSLKEQALAALSRLNSGALCANLVTDKETIRRALESLPD